MLIRSAVALLALAFSVTAALAQTKLPFALDWKFEGPSAPYFMAIDAGYFADAGLDVEITAGTGSLDAIPKVATGAFPVGFADINSVIKFLDKNPGAPVAAVMMIYDKPPFAVIGRKSLGVAMPKDLEGKVLGAPPPDGAWAQFPIFAKVNGLDMNAIKVEPVGFPVREPMLAEGKVAAITGFSFSSYLNLVRLGISESDISTLLMADYGVALYGNAIIVNTDFAKANPDAIKGFVQAVAKGWSSAIADPDAAIAALAKRNPAIDTALEKRRLELAINQNVLTDYVKTHGLGTVDPARFNEALDQLKLTYSFEHEAKAETVFTDAYLPQGGGVPLQ